MTAQTLLYREDAYLREAEATVLGLTDEGGLILDRVLFYPTGGGQPGDAGALVHAGGVLPIATTLKERQGRVVCVPAEPQAMPEIGATVTAQVDWTLRHRHMRMHTALHLLSVVVPLPVTGGAIGADKGRLDFLMPEPPTDREALEDALNRLVDEDLPVSEEWISEADLDAQPELVKTMSVQPPRGAGWVRLVRIGTPAAQVDLQPCGGTHVARTGEIGRLKLGKIENKGKQNRRINLLLDD